MGRGRQRRQRAAFVALASPDGQHLYYKRSARPGPIYEIRPDGSGDTEIVSELTYGALTYAVTKSGLWFVGAPSGKRTYWSIRLRRFADRTITEAARLDSDWSGVSLAVSPDERYVLITRLDNDSDLLLVNDFR